MRFLHKVIDRKCTNTSCCLHGESQGKHATICEESSCREPLKAVTALNVPLLLVLCVAMFCLLVGAGVGSWRLMVHARNTLTAEAFVRGSLAEATRGDADQVLLAAQQRFGLSEEQLHELADRLAGEISALPVAFTPDLKREYEKILRRAYQDGVETGPEATAISDFLKSNSLAANEATDLKNRALPRIEKARKLIQRGQRFAGQERYQEARDAFFEAAQYDTENAIAWANLGVAELSLDHREEAQHAFSNALRHGAENWFVHFSYGSFLAQCSDHEAAFEHLGNSLVLLQEDTPANLLLPKVITNLKTSSEFSSMRQDPRFQALVSER